MIEKNIKRKILSTLIILILILSGTLIMTPNAKALSDWKQDSDDDFYWGTLDNVSVNGSGIEAELKLKSLAGSWTKMNLVHRPITRWGHAMASIWGTDKVLLFGGASWPMNSIYNDTWIYDYSDNKWTEIKTGTSPSERRDHSMAPICGTKKVLLFGGGKQPNTERNDTWIFDLTDNTWTRKYPNKKPQVRLEHRLAPVWGSDEVFLFAGVERNVGGPPHTLYNDTWVYNLTNNNWIEKKQIHKPEARQEHAIASFYGTEKFIVYGGQPSTDYTWIYDLSNNKWTKEKTSSIPPKRDDNAMATIWGTDNVVMFGGLGTGVPGPTYLDDTWIYDLSEREWNKQTLSYKPSGRWEPAMATIWGTDQILLFGGMDTNTINDTWIYRSNATEYYKNGTYISDKYDTGTISAFRTLSWNGDTATGTGIKLQFRTAENSNILDNRDFLGPDGTNATYYTNPSSDIWAGHTGDRWMQFKIYMTTTDNEKTPVLKNVTIIYNNLPLTNLLFPEDGVIYSDNQPGFKWNYTDPDSTGQSVFQLLIDNESTFENVDYDSGEQSSTEPQWKFPNGTSYSELHDGTWYWKVRIKDSDGDWGPYSTPYRIVIDAAVPYSSITAPINGSCFTGLNTVTGTAFDPVNGTGLNIVEIRIKDLKDNSYWDGSGWAGSTEWVTVDGTKTWTYNTQPILWYSGTKYQIQSRAVDNATNIELPLSGVIFTIDFELPLSTIEYPEDVIYINYLENISGSAVDVNGSGLKQVEISIYESKSDNYWTGAKWQQAETWLTVSGTDMWYYHTGDEIWSAGSQYFISSRAVDNAGNVEVPEADRNFIYDDEPPSLSISINEGDEYSTSKEVELQLESTDTCSGVNLMAFSTDGTNWTMWEEFDDTKSITLTDPDGEKAIYFRVQDRIGNIAAPVSDSIILDKTPPGNLSVKINNNAEFTNTLTVSLDLNAVDNLSGLHRMSFSFDGNSWSSWEPYDNKKSIELFEDDGEKIVYFRVNDKAGNTATVFDTIILDTQPPHSLVIVIDSNAKETNSTSVNIMVDARDDISGVHQMAFSTDGITWDPWENYTETKSYTLSTGDGMKNLYFRVRDRAGNIADPAYDAILLNTSVLENIEPEEPPVEKKIESGILVIVLIIVILVIIAFFIVVFGYRRRRQRELEEQKTATETETEISSETSMITEPSTGDVVIDAAVAPPLPPAEVVAVPVQSLPQQTAEPAAAPVESLPQQTAEPAAAPVESLPLQTTEPASPATVSQPVPQLQLPGPAPAQIVTQDQTDNNSNEGS